jgi:rsbT co-antagonist protein RsbR
MDELKSRIERVVEALGRATCGDFASRVAVDDRNDDPFLEVEVGLNVLLGDLALADAKTREQFEEIQRKNQEIAERQSLALRELATPIIAVWDGVLALPVIGTVDTERSAEMMDALLGRVVGEQASHVVIDVTGVSVLDTRTADHFLRMARAVRLLGAECYLTGISPAIAQTMAELGIDTTGTRTLRRLSDALKLAQKSLAEAAA